jgi:hypothetical protein
MKRRPATRPSRRTSYSRRLLMRGYLATCVLATAVACTDPGSEASRQRSPCSTEPVALERPDVRAVAFARGEGPVFVGLGTPAVVRYAEDTRQHEGWYYYKTLWAISPEYGGKVTISGHQVDGPNQLRFNDASGFPGTKLAELHLPAATGGEWRYGPSETLIRAPGCYAFRIEGEGFLDRVTFLARD